MPVCQYFLQGKCSFGDRCRNEHPKERPSAFGQSSYQTLMSGGSQNRFGALAGNNSSGSAFGSGAVFGSSSAFGNKSSGGFGMSGTGNAFGSNTTSGSAFGNTGGSSAFGSNTSSAFGNTSSNAFKQPTSAFGASLSSGGGGGFGNTPTKKDPNAMTVTTKHPAVNELTSDHLKKLLSQNIQWKLTAFGPIGEKPSMISGTDVSPEEMRLDFYTARQQQGGNALEMYEQKYSQLEQQIAQRVNDIINNPDKYAVEWKQQNGGGNSSAFGQQQHPTSAQSAFSMPTRPATGSAFATSTSTSTTGGFGLNTKTPTSAFSTTASSKPKITTFTDGDSKSGFKYGKPAAGLGFILSEDFNDNPSSSGPPRELTSEERSSYMDPTFALGKIPEMPPIAELC